MTDLIAEGATLEKLFTGSVWAEGPVWLPELRAVRWSDIPNNRILQFELGTGQTRVYADGVEFTNGRTLDLDGRVVQCSHGHRRIERDVAGVVTPIVERFGAVRFNSPNDIVVASDGAIWFTDPPYGILSNVEGHEAPQEYDGCYVFRYDERTRELAPVITDMVRPNGLAFSPDEKLLYVSDTAGLDDAGPMHIKVYDVEGETCSNGRVFAEVEKGGSDGFRIDVEGRLWTSSDGAVEVFAPSGERLASIPVPEKVSNLCFGGDDGRDLYLTATTSLYRIRTTTTQAARPAP